LTVDNDPEKISRVSVRWLAGLGVVFAALVVVAYILESGAPNALITSPDPDWIGYYEDSRNRNKQEIAFVLIGVAGLCFLFFLGCLHDALARAEGEFHRLTLTAVVSGGAFIALFTASHAVGTSVAFAKTAYVKDFEINPDTARLVEAMGYALFAMSMFAASAMAASTAAIGLRTRAMPAWLIWLGVLAALAGLLGTLVLPFAIVLIWIAALSVSLASPRA
jgi:hypothetical protein